MAYMNMGYSPAYQPVSTATDNSGYFPNTAYAGVNYPPASQGTGGNVAYTPLSPQASYLSRPVSHASQMGLMGSGPTATPPVRSPYMTRTSHLCGFLLPLSLFVAIFAGIWTLTIVTAIRPERMLEIRSTGFNSFASNNPNILVAIYTFISSLLNAILAWAFARAVVIYIRYRVSHGSPVTLRGLSAFQAASVGAWAWHPFTSRWLWLCILCCLTFLSTTTGFNTILSPTSQRFSQVITSQEIDMSDPSFASFYAASQSNYYDCSRWTTARGMMLSPCPGGTAFTAIMNAGRSAFETGELKEISYLRLGGITFNGQTGGVLPFTSFQSTAPNRFSSAETLSQTPQAQNFTIALPLQGLTARVNCAEVSSNPVSDTGVSCNSKTPFAANGPAPSLRMRAGYCPSSNTSGGYDFHMRFFGDYVHVDGTTRHNEFLSCSVVPVTGLQRGLVYTSSDDSSWVGKNLVQQGVYPPALFEHILNTIASLANIFGQNSVDNLFAEQFVQLTTSHYGGSYTMWPLVGSKQLEGMIAYLASYERLLAEDRAAGDASVARRTSQGVLSHDSFAFAVNWATFVLLIPISVACLLGMTFLAMGYTHKPLVHFDGINTVSLVTAAAAGSLDLRDSARAGAGPDDQEANDTHVGFATGPSWGFVKKY